MSFSDARGVATSATRQASIDGYETALRMLHGYRGDPVAAIDEVLAVDSDFVMGHVLRAMVLLTMWEKSAATQVRNGLDRLASLGARANDRERTLIGAVQAWADGNWTGLKQRLDRHLIDYPRDALALQVGHLADFFHGDRDNLRGRIARALPHWRDDEPGYGFVLGMYAFGLEECGEYARAEETGRAALAIEPDDGWAHHAVTHVMEMQARQTEGIAWMQSRRAHWAQPDNAFAFHNWWHTALFHLDQGDAAAALTIYDTGVRPGASQLQLEMVDAVALLWRMHLQGIDVGSRWESLTSAYDATAEDGFYVFNDLHAMMAYVATGRMHDAARRSAAVARAAAEENTNGAMTRAVGWALVQGIDAFGRRDYGEAVERLMPVRYQAYVMGGSHAQRDVIHRTLLEAALRDGQTRLALALASERVALKPDCPFSRRQHQHAMTGCGMALAA
jgi:hypothetical protein